MCDKYQQLTKAYKQLKNTTIIIVYLTHHGDLGFIEQFIGHTGWFVNLNAPHPPHTTHSRPQVDVPALYQLPPSIAVVVCLYISK